MASLSLALSALLAATTATAVAPKPPRTTTELHQAQIDAAGRAHAAAFVAYRSGLGTLESVYQWSTRWSQAERHLDKIAALTRHRARMDLLSAEVGKRVTAGLATTAESDAVAYYLAEAELWLLEPS